MLCAYQGIPIPTNGRPALPIEVDEVLELLSDDDSYWWEVSLGILSKHLNDY